MPVKICLTMLLNEQESNLCQSLKSIAPYLDYWVIADFSCSTSTIDLVSDILSDIQGEFVEIDDLHRANAKNALITYATQFADYVLLAEPGMQFTIDDENFKQRLSADGYFIKSAMPVQHSEIRLIKTDKDWAYHGAVNEFLLAQDQYHIESIADVNTKSIKSSQQAQHESDHNSAILESVLQTSPTDAHALFNLARIKMQQSAWQESLDLFDRYLQCDKKWDVEWHWYALYHRTKICEKLGAEFKLVVQGYNDAYEFRPSRAEPLYELARIHRMRNNFAKAHLYSTTAFHTPLPETEMFNLESAVYSWHIPSEHLLTSQKLNKQTDAIEAANFALKGDAANVSRNMLESLLYYRQLSVEAIQSKKQLQANRQTENSKTPSNRASKNRIRLVVPFRNARDFLSKSIRTILSQDYDNFDATFIDDNSDDGSAELVPVDDSRFHIIRNTERVGPLVNRLNFILSCDADDIVFYLDGDDQLASTDTLSYVNDMYNQHQCWMSHGQYISQNGRFGYAQPYASQRLLMNDLESGEMRFPMHPISHRAGLMQRLREFDSELSCFKDDDGEWLFYASDAVLARPLFYMAGVEKVHYCDRVLYLYTEGHEISESIDNKSDQLETCRIIATRLRPPKISDYRPSLQT